MNTIVIGGAGFVGSNLCKRLLESKHKVVCFDNFSLGNEKNIEELINNKDFTLVKGDASVFNELDSVFERYKPEYVFHLAANSDIQASALNPDVEYKNTYSTTFAVLSCMRKHNVKKIFFSSTSAVYGDKRNIELDENTPSLMPISYYGAAKLGCEAMISAFSYMNEISELVFRFPNVIGENLTHGVIYDFMHRLRDNNSELVILGDGRQTKQYIYIQDLIDAIIQFMNSPVGVTLYNVGVEGATSVTRIADIICEEMGLENVKYNYTGGECGWKGDVPKFKYNINKIHNAGWHAKHNSDEAVRITVKKILEEIN